MGTGRRPSTKIRARALVRQKTALALVGEGKPLTAIAEQLEMTVQGVRKCLRKALETESIYPANLTPERVQELRALEAERLNKVWASGIETIDAVKDRVGSDREKSLDASSVARLLDGLTRISERLSRLLGLDQPTKIIEQQLRVSYAKTDTKVTISFDRSPIAALAQLPVPGLSIGGASLLGNGEIADTTKTAPESPLEALAQEAT